MSSQANNQGGKKKNGGYMIANDRANDRQPHFRGKATIEGKEYLVSAWRQEPRDGKEMFSIELTDPATLPARPGRSTGAPAGAQASQQTSPPRPAPAPRSEAPSDPRSQPSTPPPPGEDKAFDDIFGGDGSQW